jgi:hypothetical protein
MMFGKSNAEVLRVRFMVGIAGEHFSYVPGEVVDLRREDAQRFIRSGTAELAIGAEIGRPLPPGCRRCGSPIVAAGVFCAICLSSLRTGGRR